MTLKQAIYCAALTIIRSFHPSSSLSSNNARQRSVNKSLYNPLHTLEASPSIESFIDYDFTGDQY